MSPLVAASTVLAAPPAGAALLQATAGLTVPARAKASAPPAAATARFFLIRPLPSVVLPFDRTLRSCLKRRWNATGTRSKLAAKPGLANQRARPAPVFAGDRREVSPARTFQVGPVSTARAAEIAHGQRTRVGGTGGARARGCWQA